MALRGLKTVLQNLNKEIEAVEGRTDKGVAAAAALIQKESVKKTPVDTGNLRGSAYVKQIKNSYQIGFSAKYALAVHENVGQKLKGQPRKLGTKKGTYWETGEPKFLENAVKENKAKILQKVKSFAEIE